MLLILETRGNFRGGIPLEKKDLRNKTCFFISCGLQWVIVIKQRHKRYSIISNSASFPSRSLPYSSEFRQVYGLIWCLVGGTSEVPGEWWIHAVAVNVAGSAGWFCITLGPSRTHCPSSQPSLLLRAPLCRWGRPRCQQLHGDSACLHGETASPRVRVLGYLPLASSPGSCLTPFRLNLMCLVQEVNAHEVIIDAKELSQRINISLFQFLGGQSWLLFQMTSQSILWEKRLFLAHISTCPPK